MEDYDRSRSYGTGSMQIDNYNGPPRSYSTNSYSQQQTQMGNDYNNNNRDLKMKKGKYGSSSSSSSWNFGDPEFQRKKRVASYKMYSVEGKMKGTFRKSFRWLKDKYTHVLYGWW